MKTHTHSQPAIKCLSEHFHNRKASEGGGVKVESKKKKKKRVWERQKQMTKNKERIEKKERQRLLVEFYYFFSTFKKTKKIKKTKVDEASYFLLEYDAYHMYSYISHANADRIKSFLSTQLHSSTTNMLI